MKYKKSDLAKVFQDLGNLEKIEDVRVKVAEIQKDLEADYTEHEEVVSKNTEYKQEIDDLQKANKKLFILVGKDDSDKDQEKDPNENDDKTKNLTYENLFNEKGELK